MVRLESLVSACLIIAKTVGAESPSAAEAAIEVQFRLKTSLRRMRTAVSSV